MSSGLVVLVNSWFDRGGERPVLDVVLSSATNGHLSRARRYKLLLDARTPLKIQWNKISFPL